MASMSNMHVKSLDHGIDWFRFDCCHN